ncbi:MAG: sensor histidine kinase [Rubrivivax sp.]|nr:sensor histidine kinase [Rubrivivax sp.]
MSFVPRLIRHSPLTLVLACAAAATMLFISEGTYYWRAANLLESREEISRVLLASRIGIAVLTAISLLALYFYLRQAAVVQRQQAHLNALTQADHHRLELEVARRTAELTELTQHLLTAREDERSRLARDLHDELGALLTSAKLDAARIRSRLGQTAPEAQDRLAHLVLTLNGVIALKRRIVEDLRPSSLSNLGLVATLEILAREFAQASGLPVHCELQPVPLDADADLVVYRVVQEGITNIGKHARARQVWLGLGQEGDQVVVTLRDDGVGFDPQTRPSAAHGLMGMRFRVQAEGGRLELVSAPGRGTAIRVQLPCVAGSGESRREIPGEGESEGEGVQRLVA